VVIPDLRQRKGRRGNHKPKMVKKKTDGTIRKNDESNKNLFFIKNKQGTRKLIR
jgi:hypothetical protein